MTPAIERSPLTASRAWALVLGLLLSAPGAAADSSARACREDARQHCGAIQPGGGRALACLEKHEHELTVSCRAALPALKRCGQEVLAVCGHVTSRQAALACLRKHPDTPSAECRALVPAR